MQLIEKVLVVGILIIITTILAIAISGIGSIDDDNPADASTALKIAAKTEGAENGEAGEMGGDDRAERRERRLPVPPGRGEANRRESPASGSSEDEADPDDVRTEPRVEGPAHAVPYRRYVVKEGETFESIAEKQLGEKGLWEEIAKLNEEVDPRRIAPGTMIYIPTGDVARSAPSGSGLWARSGSQTNSTKASSTQTIYTVQRGDTLSGIARRFLNKSTAWNKIWDANREVIGDPNSLKPGMKLRIPDDA